MDNYVVDPNKMFSTKVCFNGGKPNLFMVWDDFTLKDLKNQPDEINQRLNHGDTRRVEDIWYECPSFNSVGRLTLNRMMVTNDDDMRNMFSIFGQHNMFPTIEMDALLFRSSEDIPRV
jgi:hypothetical protein